ncbi:MAG: hypothetical protein DWQ08_15145 [Proteobacteria bacterium]|nr:MAG: hypothetical protein DWQ08_15145 [Pseudomonadota bacterium]
MTAPAMVLLAILAGAATSAVGGIQVRSETGADASSSIETGGKRVLVIDDEGARFSIGGHAVDLSAGYAIAGSTADHQYLAIISGEARLDALTLERGEVLLLQPWGESPRTAIFEAASLAGFARGIDPGLDAALEKLVRSQNRKLFFGRYTRTAFDLHNPGGEEHESGRRRVVGDDAISAIRYSGDRDQVDIERRVVSQFVDAMNRGSMETAAMLLDPTRYGGATIDELGMRARVATASLLARGWENTDAGDMHRDSDRLWKDDAGLQIRLVITGDFIYVTSVSQGN